MTRVSFHERIWDLQQRKSGAERLKNHLAWIRIGEKLHLNSMYGKISYRPIGKRPDEWYDTLDQVYKKRVARAAELHRLAREFRPF